MISLNIELNVSTVLKTVYNWISENISSRRYDGLMEKVDLLLLRSISFVIMVGTVFLIISMIPKIAYILNAIIRYIPNNPVFFRILTLGIALMSL
jgi:hypothetical protein